jgi:uncharacterized damage-inducible protein DinB
MQTVTSLKQVAQLYSRYNLWANTRISDYLLQLDPALLDKEIKSSFTSIRKTVLHIWDAEYIWLQRLNGESISNYPSKDSTTLPAIDAFLAASETFEIWVNVATEDILKQEVSYTNIKGENFSEQALGMVLHCFNHSTFHRGQIITMLRELNCNAPILSTDLITFLREEKK